MTHAEKAKQLFESGYNCAQAVMCAFSDVAGFNTEMSAKLASSFGGGIGRLREVCGAVSAAEMILGLTQGYGVLDEGAVKKQHYARVRELANAFVEKEGTYICRELLKDVETTPGGEPEARTPEYYARRPCSRCVYEASEILDSMLNKQ